MAALDQNAGTTTSTASNMDKTKDIYPLVIDIAPKVRKPYTVTRQREKWTEDEHRRFLEAVKLYGRGWRQIEEHVGTKTAVQIRSHAQKFFAKFARGFNGDPGGSESPIGIPPPRPKRKPIHPYPRKTLLVKLTSNSYPPERSPSPNCSSMEKETSSPTSVLSATCSEGQQSGSLSPTSCTTVLPNISSNEAGRLNSAREGDDLGIMCLTWTRRKLPSTICDLKPKDLSSRDGVTGANAPIVIKLFGRTVMVAEHEKPLPHDTNMGKENSATEDDTKLDEPSSMNEDQVTQLSLGQIYNSPVHLSSAQLSSDVPQCWQMYQSPPFIYLAPSNPPPLWGLTSEKEKSSSGSRAMIFTGEAETRDTVADSIDSKCETKPCKARNSQRGFVPCKRCAVEGD